MTISKDVQIEALSKSVNTLDATRRVGWAKAFESDRQKDEILRDLNLARGDLDVMCNFAAWVYGFILEIAPGTVATHGTSEALALTMLPEQPLRQGRTAGRKWIKGNRAKAMPDDITAEFNRLRNLIQRGRKWEERAKADKKNYAKAMQWDLAVAEGRIIPREND